MGKSYHKTKDMMIPKEIIKDDITNGDMIPKGIPMGIAFSDNLEQD